MKKLLPALPVALTALVACTPTQRPPTTQILPQMTLLGNTLNVTLINAGPYNMQLQNTCPRPFAVNFTEYPGRDKGGIAPGQLGTCSGEKLPSQTWVVGERLSVSIPISYPAGTHTFKAFATVRAKVLQPKGAANDYADMNVSLPPLTVTVQ